MNSWVRNKREEEVENASIFQVETVDSELAKKTIAGTQREFS